MYKKKRGKCMLWAVMCAGFLIFHPSGVLAYGTGRVSIDLQTEDLDTSGNRIPYIRKPELLPEQTIPYIIRVDNLEVPVWLRLGLSYETNAESEESTIRDSWLKGVDESRWVKRGDYWYYKRPLETGQSVDFCKELEIPDLCDVPETITCRIASWAEAVQAVHVTPDFDAENPFEGLLIDDSTVANETEKEVSGFEIRCRNGAENIVDDSHMFHEIRDLMPGDRLTGYIRITNTNPYGIRVVLTETGRQMNELLFKKLKLRMTKNGAVLYDGSLMDLSLENGFSLGHFSKGSRTDIFMELELPEAADNRVSGKNIDVLWSFAAERTAAESTGWRDDKDDSDSGGTSSGSLSEGAGEIANPAVYAVPDPTAADGYAGGRWHLIDEEKKLWEYIFANGLKAADGWLYLYNPYSGDEQKYGWFCFDETALMRYGWIRTDSGNWYFCHEMSDGNLGRLVKGWHHDEDDGRSYYLDPVTGIMQSGWREIDGKYYYFAVIQEIPHPNWFWNTAIGRWVYNFLGFRTYGSMYRNERTPDGHRVDSEGAWDGCTPPENALWKKGEEEQ